MPLAQRPVLVTGSNRSGTTWVGHMLCLSDELAYVHEPFNPGIWPRWTTTPIPYRNLYLCDENAGPWKAEFQAVIDRQFPLRAHIGEIKSPRDVARLIRDATSRWRPQALHRVGGAPTLMKDPIAIFSSEWLASTFDLQVVMMVRGPLAFAGSIKRLNWAFDFTNWTDQPLLMRDHLDEMADQITRATVEPFDLIDQAILSWNATYSFVAKMRDLHPTWSFVDYQSLAQSPLVEFESLYNTLGLSFNKRVADAILEHSDESNAKDVASGDKGTIRRDSLAAIDTWMHRLSPEETERVEQGTAVVASRLEEPGQRP